MMEEESRLERTVNVSVRLSADLFLGFLCGIKCTFALISSHQHPSLSHFIHAEQQPSRQEHYELHRTADRRVMIVIIEHFHQSLADGGANYFISLSLPDTLPHSGCSSI